MISADSLSFSSSSEVNSSGITFSTPSFPIIAGYPIYVCTSSKYTEVGANNLASLNTA